MTNLTLKHALSTMLALALLALPAGIGWFSQAEAVRLRLKDITHVKGVRNNQLTGFGLVVGLSKTGDKSQATQTTTWNMIGNFGQRIDNPMLVRTTNTAAVIVSAIVPPFAKPGDQIDVIVSSMADASSLEGGILVNTQLRGPNGEVIALAQGPISTGGTSVSAGGSSTRTGIVTTGRIPGGAIMEREMMTPIGDENGFDLLLDRTDFAMATKVARVITENVAPARAIDGSTVRVVIPDQFVDDRVSLLAKVEALQVEGQNESAKVVINERTGTIVIGNSVHLLPAAVAHGGITVSVVATNTVSQPGAMSGNQAQTVGVTNAEIKIDKASGSLVQLGANATLQDLVTALNAIGVKPSDLISVLQALKAAGSLEATLEII